MKIKSFEFNLRELAGSMGDFGTLFPLAIGYIVICGLNPAGFLVMMGLCNIITGLIYRLPVPIEPMKIIAIVAIAQQWTPSMVYASGFGMGIIWILLALTGIIERISKITPNSVIRGIQVTLGILLMFQAYKMISTNWIISIVAIIIVLLFRQNRYAPAAIILVIIGLFIMLIQGQFDQISSPVLSIPAFTTFSLKEVWQTLLLAGFAQVPLTATNATIATSSLIKKYWPEKKVSEKQLAWNQGIMNIILPFLGGMPTCHGAGGLAGQYYFGARTGGANILEGLIEIFLGLFLSASIASLFSVFPTAIIGTMMFMVGIGLLKFAQEVKTSKNIIPMVITILIALVTNMFYGFLAGIASHYLISFLLRPKIN
ncbi:MAG: putative sulfate/molybdate transporter [Atribacterota bacterium]|nr:putative sulfate/molybdate transporter [Atribacterota bacterium]MDD4896263.1 putative sulfate/molybdate transporter [Atribacterota bacterium]MDD5637329.1 putative sulfate/molybdate transporter [Atribacterota bacterium]